MEFNQSRKDSLIAKLTEITKANLRNEHFGVSELAREVGMSRSNLHRRVKTITNVTVSQFIRSIRLKRALELLRESSMTISEVAIESGFSSLTYFTKCFKNYYGVPPSKFITIEEEVASPVNEKNPERKSNHWSFRAAGVWIPAAIVGIVLVLLLILKPDGTDTDHFVNENTIAVLPCGHTGPDEDDAFLGDGLVNEIRFTLDRMENLTVSPRATVERYRDTEKSIKEIGKELDVKYILEGKASSIQGSTMILFQLYDVLNDKPLWTEPLQRKISIESIFDVQKEAILAVTSELNTKLAQQEKEQIEKFPTNDLAAYNCYLLGWHYIHIQTYTQEKTSSKEAIFKAKRLLEQAIDLDSTFADAYAALGSLYIDNLCYSQSKGDLDVERKYLDSGLVVADKALFYDSENQNALRIKAAYYERIGLHQKATQIWKKLSFDDEQTYYYYQKEVEWFYSIEDYYGTIESFQKYLELKPQEVIEPPYLLKSMIKVFRQAGFPEYERLLADHLLDLTDDSVEYLMNMVSAQIYQGNFGEALKYALEASRLDPANSYCYWLTGLCYAWLKDFSNAIHFIVVSENLITRSGDSINPNYISGYIYLMNGEKTEADYHLNGAVARRLQEIEHSTSSAQQYASHIYLAAAYLALGNEGKAFEYLENMKELQTIDYGWINILENWPGLLGIRKSSEFQGILKQTEAKFQKQHERIGTLTEKLDLNHL